MSVNAEPVLRVICADLPAPPLFWRDAEGIRHGYEADVARALAQVLGRRCEFVYTNWADFYPRLTASAGDVLLCGQGISAYRKTLADFTEPYAVFDEAVMILRRDNISAPADLMGKRVGAIANSVNMALAQTFTGAITVAFEGSSDDVMGDMVAALRAGEIDAFVDDDVALVPLANEPDLSIAFLHPSRNPWGIAVDKALPQWREEVDEALQRLKTNGQLAAIWQQHLPELAYPF